MWLHWIDNNSLHDVHSKSVVSLTCALLSVDIMIATMSTSGEKMNTQSAAGGMVFLFSQDYRNLSETRLFLLLPKNVFTKKIYQYLYNFLFFDKFVDQFINSFD
jgi:hypothetical protein